jgi:branched-chain amino acid aminotransferase
MHFASLDGAIGPSEEARISVTDEGLLRGDGVFEVARIYGGRPFALEEHLRRLEQSGQSLRLEVDAAAIRVEAGALLEAAGEVDAVLRIVVTRGGRRILLVEPLPELGAAVRLGLIAYSPTRVLDGIKSLSYAGNMLATRLAREVGYDEALLVTPHGRVLEAPTSSFFWVRDGELRTPPLDDHILASITRQIVIEECDVREAPCPVEELESADEAFLASSLREVQPVSAIETRALPTGAQAGPRTAEAARAIRVRIDAELSTQH